MATADYLDLEAHNSTISTTNNGTVAITTTGNDEVLLLLVGAEQTTGPSISVVSVTDTAGLTWAKRKSATLANGSQQLAGEVWWAHMPTAGATTITVTFSEVIDDACLLVAAIKGVLDPTDPWVSSSVGVVLNDWPESVGNTVGVSRTTYGSSSGTLSGTVGSVNAIPLAFAMAVNIQTTDLYATGFTAIQAVNNTGGISACRIAMSFNEYTTELQAETVVSAKPAANAMWFIDAMKISTGPPIPTQANRKYGTIIA
jgi:hypothetical protein